MADNALYLVAQAAGVLLLGAVIWLLKSRTIYIDSDTKQAIEFELPVLGKIKSQQPVLIVILIGAALVLYPLKLSNDARAVDRENIRDEATVTGEIETNKPVTVTVLALPKFQQTVQASGPFEIHVPVLPDSNYRAWFTVDGKIAQDQAFTVANKQASLLKFVNKLESTQPPLVVRKDISDAELAQLGIR